MARADIPLRAGTRRALRGGSFRWHKHTSPVLLLLSVIIAMVAGTAALWCANKLSGLRATLVASLIMGVAVSGMHYTGMAALHVYPAPADGMLSVGTGAGATSFLLPLILGISILTFLVTAIVTMAPRRRRCARTRP